jgi:CubicO group peptidase (beta-lactamase class C family)
MHRLPNMLVALMLAMALPALVQADPVSCPGGGIRLGADCVTKADAARRIDDIVRKAMAEKHLKAVIAGATINGETLLVKAWGSSMTGVPATADMHFRNGAVAIAYLGIVALQLQEKGVLNLDDKLSRWFPGYPKADHITLRMLLNATSGYADYVNLKILPLYQDPFRAWQPDELIALGLKQPMVCEPGTCFAYAHTNFVILGKVLEKVTGRGVDELIRDGVLAPLGLDDTRSEQTAVIQEPVLHAFDDERGIYDLLEPVLDAGQRRGDDLQHPRHLEKRHSDRHRGVAVAGVRQTATRAGNGQAKAVERRAVLWARHLCNQRLADAEPVFCRLRRDHGLSAGKEARHRCLGDGR